jgi:hypothetical protein
MIAQLGGCGDVTNFGVANLNQLRDLANLVGGTIANITGDEQND